MKEVEQKELGAVNIIAKGTQVQGNINTNGDCRIDGIVKGNIMSKAKVIIGQSGVVDGNIVCASIEIEGNVKAENLSVSDLIFLKSSANLIGNINAGKIAIEPGAEFSGNCRMNNQKSAPANAPAAPVENK